MIKKFFKNDKVQIVGLSALVMAMFFALAVMFFQTAFPYDPVKAEIAEENRIHAENRANFYENLDD